jgi:hypothetical protein
MAVERSSKLDLFTFQRRLEKADMRSLRVATSKTIHSTSSKQSLFTIAPFDSLRLLISASHMSLANAPIFARGEPRLIRYNNHGFGRCLWNALAGRIVFEFIIVSIKLLQGCFWSKRRWALDLAGEDRPSLYGNLNSHYGMIAPCSLWAQVWKLLPSISRDNEINHADRKVISMPQQTPN